MVNVIISYSTRDENGNKYAKQLADDLHNYYGVKVCADLEDYRCFTGKPWLDGFLERLPEHDYYILVVTETFGKSNAMKEFERAKNCPEPCQGICGRDKNKNKNACKLEKIIPCFFTDPSNAPTSVTAISGIREFYYGSYERGFNQLIKDLFPPPDLTSLKPSELGEIIESCKKLEDHLNAVKEYYSMVVNALNSVEYGTVEGYLRYIRREFDEICSLYRQSPNPIKNKLKIDVLKEIEDILNKASDDLSNIKAITKLVKTEGLINELNKLLKEDLASKLKNQEVRSNG